MTDDELIIRPQDVVLAGHCAAGMRQWFADVGLSYDQFKIFMKRGEGGGLPASVILATGHEYGKQVVDRKRAREQNDG